MEKIEKLKNNVTYKYMSEYVADDCPSTREQLMDKINEIIDRLNELLEPKILVPTGEQLKKFRDEQLEEREDKAREEGFKKGVRAFFCEAHNRSYSEYGTLIIEGGDNVLSEIEDKLNSEDK